MIETRIKAAALDALEAALVKDPAPIVVNIRVLADHGDGALYYACCLWGETLRRLVADSRAVTARVQLEFRDLGGQLVDPNGDAALPAATVWAGRFLAAVMARDAMMATALFDACRRRPDFVDNYVMGLLQTVSRGALGWADQQRPVKESDDEH